LSSFAAHLFATWKVRGGEVAVPDSARTLLSGFVPVLEGLALYAQLDYLPKTDENGIPSPLLLFSGLTHHRYRGVPIETLFINIREGTFHYGEDRKSLLDILFLDTRREDRAYYLAGYLYVKAMAEDLARRCPQLADPTLVLPFMIRLICDHPLIDRALTENLHFDELFETIHQDLTEISGEDLSQMACLIDDHPQLRRNFDHWDIHAQLLEGHFSHPVLHSEDSISPYLKSDTSSQVLFGSFRACSAVHVLAWTTGLLKAVSRTAIVLEVDGAIQVIKRLSVEDRFAFWRRIVHEDVAREERFDRDQHFWYWLEQRVVDKMAGLIGQPITLGLFFTLTRGNLGLGIWQDEQPVGFLPFFPIDTEDEVEMLTLTNALRISPWERTTFTSSLDYGGRMDLRSYRAAKKLLGTLSSRSRDQRMILRSKFKFIEEGEFIHPLKLWCNPAPLRREPLYPPVDLIDAMEAIIDFPGFCRGKLRLAGLFPSLGATV
jgi:hypothetical protein